MKATPSHLRSHVPTAPLVKIMQACASSLDVSGIFTAVAQQMGHILSHDAMAVLLRPVARYAGHVRDTGNIEDIVDIEHNSEIAIPFCDPPVVDSDQPWSLTDFSFSPVLLTNQPAVITDFAARADRHAGDRLLLEHFGHAGMVVPIAAASLVLGGLVLISRTAGVFSPDDALLLEPIAGLLALALEHQRLDEQARALAVAEERNRMAREFHDTLAHSLTSIIINIESLKPHGAAQGRVDTDLLADTEALARGALEETRRSILELHPTPLRHQSLRDALTAELAALAKRASLATQFYMHGTERSLQPDQATTLFRVAQEAFHNIYKHAAAREVMLGLAFEEAVVVLTIEDDGVGFASAPSSEYRVPNISNPLGIRYSVLGTGFGIQSMAARARRLGGQLLVTSQPGHGTIVRATIPYAPSSQQAEGLNAMQNWQQAESSHPGGLPVLGLRPIQAGYRLPSGSVDASSEAQPIRVLLVDDHPVVRRGIRQVLEEQPDIRVVGEAGDGLAAVEQAGLLYPDVVLLDLQMPGLTGVQTLPRLRAVHPPANVVMLTVFSQDEELFAALKAGARGYILKDATAAVIVEAVRDGFLGRASLSHELETRVIDHLLGLAQRVVDPEALTEREVEILGYMRQGRPYKEIGAQLNITAKTVNYHVTHILRKLHARSRGEAVAVAVERGLLSRA